MICVEPLSIGTRVTEGGDVGSPHSGRNDHGKFDMR